MMTLSAARVRRRRTGSIAVMMAVLLVVVMGFAALVIDMGYSRLVQAQLQSAADAAALAGASQLDNTVSGLSDARAMAVAVAALNDARGETIELDENTANSADGGVVLGVWADGAFTPSTDPATVNAVQVNLADEGMGAMFSRVAWENDALAAAATSIAQQGLSLGASEVAWYWPFGLPDCMFEMYDGDDLVDMTFRLSPDGADNTGWTALDATINASWASEHLSSSVDCMQEWWSTGEVSSDCPEGSTAATADTSNGELTSGLQTITSLLSTEGIAWDSTVWGSLPSRHSNSSVPVGKYGKMLVGPFPVIDAGDEYCTTGGKWNTTYSVKGFVWGAIYDVADTKSPKNIWARIDPTSTYDAGTAWGGGDYGVTATGPPTVTW